MERNEPAGYRIAFFLIGAALLILGLTATRASAQAPHDPYYDEEAETSQPATGDGVWSAHAGVGFTLSPTAALFAGGVEYEALPRLGIGPLLQVAFDDDITIVAPTAHARYRFDLSDLDNEVLRNVEPFVQGGLGFAFVEKDRPGNDPDDTEFLLNGGFGVEYRIDDTFSVGNSILFNGMPADDAVGEDFFVSWQFLTARMRF